MQGDPQVLEVLNEVLTAELTAINQYFLHAKMCEHWGYGRLAATVRVESIDEMKHADSLTDRILFLGRLPNFQRLSPLRISETVVEQFESDLQLEYNAINRLNRAVALCVEVGDNGPRELLASILVSEEEHADWLETITQIGAELYLSQKLYS